MSPLEAQIDAILREHKLMPRQRWVILPALWTYACLVAGCVVLGMLLF